MIVKLVILYLSLFTSARLYADVGLALTKASTAVTTQEPQASLPQANQLVSGWWDYFAVEGELLKKRREEARQYYPKLVANLPVASKDSALGHLGTFISNLNALQELSHAPPVSNAPKLWVAQAKYSIPDWLSYIDTLRQSEWAVQQNQHEIDNAALALDAAQNRLNALMLDYLAMNPLDSNKLLLGLDIMAKRSAMAVGEQQLKLSKNQLEQKRAALSSLRALNQQVSEQLSSDKDFVQQTGQRSEELEKKYTQAQSNARRALLETLGVVEQTPQALSVARLTGQQALNAMIDEAAVQLELLLNRAQYQLALLLLGQVSDIKAVHNDLQRWQQQQQHALQAEQGWLKATNTELTQVQELMIRLSAEQVPESERLMPTLKQRLKTAQTGLIALKQMETDNDTLVKLNQEIHSRLVQHSSKLSIWLAWSVAQFLPLKQQLLELWTQPLLSIGDTPITTAGIVRVIFIIGLAGLISSLFQRVMAHLTKRRDVGEHGHVSVFYTVGRLAHYVILLIGSVIALSSIGLDFTNLALVAGALSVGIGFGLQSIVNNFVSGLILLFEGTIKVGDFIELDTNTYGVVREINVRSTQISTPDGIDIIVPNSMLASNQVINWTLRDANRRIRVPFTVAYGTDKALVEQAVLEAASQVSFTHQPQRGKAAQCWLVKFGDNGLHFELVVWINQEAIKKPAMVYATYLWEIDSCLTKYKIEIPFPQRELHLRSVDSRIKF